MFPAAGQLTGNQNYDANVPLEDRLRGMILSNATASQESTIPLHIGSAPQEDQQAYLATAARRMEASSSPSSNSRPQASKKRPNQAERRQMNAQLAVSVHTSPNKPPMNRQSWNQNSQFRAQGHRQHDVNQGQPIAYHPTSSSCNQNQMNAAAMYQNRQAPYQGHFQNPGHQNAGIWSAEFHLTTPMHAQPRSYPQGYDSLHDQPGTRHFQQQFQGPSTQFGRPPPQSRQLYQSNVQNRGRPFGVPESVRHQCAYLDSLVQTVVPTVGIDDGEQEEKEAFRKVIEQACKLAIAKFEHQKLLNSTFDSSTVELKCFGSMSSGFATKASDVDLALITPTSIPAADSPESPIPRLLEGALLDLGFGARLLPRTRVPIIKLCQKPTAKLLEDLKNEREKWEAGFESGDDHKPVELTAAAETTAQSTVAIVEADSRKPIVLQSATETTIQSTTAISKSDSSSPNTTPISSLDAENTRASILSKLKQKEGQSLGDYYFTTKRLLPQLGTRDISASTQDLNEKEGNMLNAVCKAFIQGLRSQELIQRLHLYHSIHPLFDVDAPPLQRSLSGVFNQVEGERLAMAWDIRPLTESNNRREFECLTIVDGWRNLQDKRVDDPVPYNRLLYLAAEKLKHISSLQLVYLEQNHLEDPIYYHKRAIKILEDLKGRGVQQERDSITPIVISHYISGISEVKIQDVLRSMNSGQMSLAQISFEHRVQQLAADYENATRNGVFGHDDQSYVAQYIRLLQAPDRDTTAENNVKLAAKIRSLPDPKASAKSKDRYKDQLEFPKTDVGIQCDINFSADLALHNTQMLRCYSHSDPRVKQMVLLVKNWAKARGINTPYRGTLSSYGYVLMVLHYLVNVARPFVCPNLQLVPEPGVVEAQITCQGRDVRFWRNERKILDLANRGILNHNKESTGSLLRGFFEYFSQNNHMLNGNGRGFDWGREVLSLRTLDGRLTKLDKGWVSAKTVHEVTTVAAPPNHATGTNTAPKFGSHLSPEGDVDKPKQKTVEEVKEIRHRYLFAIEDPFELDHNVARTVTHDGIVSIRDEFRRAWRIILNTGRIDVNGFKQEETLLEPAWKMNTVDSSVPELMARLHGPKLAETT
ncbi:caffeine-induced death protein-like protein [Calycina marina]|uniref:Caffeine-induced death protein-like protein n=1 Tax=Calycina marina TaxID=1763456 RepID=A0A9P7YWQ9_9HELO|nr:caffeine-induced death protein-like protein [Calycina marina]